MKNIFLLVLTALIWGVAFVAQSEGGDAVGIYSFNAVRNIIATAFLWLFILLRDKKIRFNLKQNKDLFWGGIWCGAILFLGSALQQIGLYLGAPAGKAGFLTACYILIVPIISIFLKKKCGYNVWIAVFVALGGLYLLCINGSFTVKLSDLVLFSCAFVFAAHIIVIDYYSPKVDGVKLSCMQFFVAALLNIIPMLVFDFKTAGGVHNWVMQFTTLNAWIPILYAGLISSGIGYTLQIIAQKGVNPTIASLIMSLESVFSVLAGWVLLGQNLSGREIFGCVLIFAAIVFAQLPLSKTQIE